MRLPTFDEVAGNGFATIDAYLGFQRAAVAAARREMEEVGMAFWVRLSEAERTRFAMAAGETGDVDGAWRRAFWLYAIGGKARAPFEIGIRPEMASTLMAALGPLRLPAEVPQALDHWWGGLLERCRGRIAAYVRERVVGAERRLAAEGVMPAADSGFDSTRSDAEGGERVGRRRGRGKRRASGAEVRRVRMAEERVVAAHRELDHQFSELGPVCGVCTRETGGCCSLTVPLLFREPDFRLLALGGAVVPSPVAETRGQCPFLGPTGCRLPSERRPHICRSFLCDTAEAALAERIGVVRDEIEELTAARSRLG